MNILIITGGNVEEQFLQEYLQEHSFETMIAADRGLYIAHKLGLKVDHIVGDFDSVPEEVLKHYQNTSVSMDIYPREKDFTDTEIAIDLALSLNPESISIIGATGTRLDHTLANIHLLMKPLSRGILGYIIDKHNKIYLKDRPFQISKGNQFGDYVSLLPFGEVIENITLKGFKYPLNHARMIPGYSIGVSNEIIEEEASIIWDQGILMVFESRD